MNALHLIAVVLYVVALAGLLVYGQNALAMVWAHWRKRAGDSPLPPTENLPVITVQLPIYNERYVAARLLDAVARLDYPRERLEIQVLDDSTDDTPSIVAHIVTTLKGRGLDITHIRRRHRAGFKAGALSEGLGRARGEYVAIFDADFVPSPDVLRRLLPSFEPDVACVQARWGHLNRAFSVLTRAQAMTIDAHFAVEQTARARGGVYTSFDGTAGIWRKAAIIDGGGWSAETLTEDLELSYRVQLRGWRIVQRPDVECAAELPVLVSALKIQQRRWAKGTTQTAVKLLLRVLVTPLAPWKRYQACLHLTSSLIYPCALAVAVLTPVVFATPEPWLSTLAGPAVLVGLLGPVAQTAYAQWILGQSWRRTLRDLPAAVIVGAGLTYSTSLAVLGAFVLRRPHDWARTPKYGIAGTAGTWRGKGYTQRAPWTALVELVLGVYCARSAWDLVDSQIALAAVLFVFATGFVAVGALTIAQSLGIARDRAGVATRVRAVTERSAAAHARAA